MSGVVENIAKRKRNITLLNVYVTKIVVTTRRPASLLATSEIDSGAL
jgi:hypothetical protein